MASLVDIPDHLLDPTQADAFTQWLISLPVPTRVRRDLAHTWQTNLSTHLGNINWTLITRAPEPHHVP
jgi:hypothetical protein